MRRTVQDIFTKTNFDKQVMMFTATLNNKMEDLAGKFMKDVISLV